jgi:hypothetical protein
MDKVDIGTQVRVARTGTRGEVVDVLDGGWTGWALVLEANDSSPHMRAFDDLLPWDGKD